MSRILLTRTPLQLISADVLAYGAKDTGEMGGGAAAAISAACGENLSTALGSELSKAASLQIGDIFFTDSFDLAKNGVRWIAHVISIIKHTPQGAWCPQPARLSPGVRRLMEESHRRGAKSIAISALATGEGRVKPEEAAALMLDPALNALRNLRAWDVTASFSLPTHRDYEAFQTRLEGLGGSGDILNLE